MKYLFLLITLIAVGCGTESKQSGASSEDANVPTKASGTPKNKTETGYILALNKIDNKVNVYVEDSLIYSSGTIQDSPEVDFRVDLTAYIKDKTETIKIELINGLEPYNEQIDPYWEIKYDLIFNGEIVDFRHERGDDNAIGKVYETSYVVNEWE